MTSSSFGNLIGKERDEIPGYGIKNYAETEPDLTDAVNKQIEANQQDTIQFYNEMAEIQKLIAETPMRNLESLAQFSRSAGQAMEVFKDRQEARELRQESDDFLEKNSGAELYTKEGTFELENAKFQNQLNNENTDASLNYLYTLNIETPQDLGIKQLLKNLNNNYFGARSQIMNERGAQDITDADEFIALHDAADELMVTAMLRKARELGIDTNSREFKKAFYNTVYPDIKQRRENNLQSWKGNANRNFNKINKKKTRKIIVDTLAPYSEGAKFDIDVMTLVETVKNRMNFDTPREAIEYIFSEVAAENAEDGRRLFPEHLEYLYNGAIFKHSATGKLSTIEEGDFPFKGTLNSLMQNAEIERANEVQQSNRADEVLAKDEYAEFLRNNPNGAPPQVEAEFLRELELKYPSFDASTLNSGSGDTGGEYDGQAGKPDANNQYYKDLENALVGTGTEKLAMTSDLRFQIDKAYGDLQRRVANQTAVGVEPDVAQRNAYDQVEANLLAGKYTLSSVEDRQGRSISPNDILDDRNLLQADTNTVRFNNEYNSIAEKKALLQYKAHRLYGDVPFPNYFKGIVKGTKINAEDFAEDRFTATGGYDSTGNIAQRFSVNKDGILVDKQFGLTKEELNEFNVKPHLTKTNIKMLQNPELADKVLLGFRKKGNELGTYQPNVGFGKNNGDQLTVAEVIKFSKRGSSNWGVFGFSSQEILEATKSGAIPKDALFDEEIQSQMVFELLRQRSNRTNSIRGAIVQAKSGGEQTIFEGDEEIGRWDRLVNMKPSEVKAVLNTFPMLRDMPTNQFQNLTAGVILEIEGIIKKEEAQDDAVSRALRVDRQLEYYNDLLARTGEGNQGILGIRRLSKLTVSQERVREIIAELEANRKVLEDANPNLELLIKKYKLEND